MKIVFDLDGVLRDLNTYLEDKYGIPIPQTWYWDWQGKGLYDWVLADEFKILSEAPSTPYLSVITEHITSPLEVWTSQPKDWCMHTLKWAVKYLPKNSMVLFMSPEEKEERVKSGKGTILIEDSPNFTSYQSILVIDQPYNRCISKMHYRVKCPSELGHFLLNVKARGGLV